MKYINKFQEGSAFPFALSSMRGMFSILPTTAVSTGTSETTTSSKKKKDDDGDLKILDLSVIKEVMQNALPNESNHFFNLLYAFEAQSPFYTSSLDRSAVIALAKEAATIVHNNKLYEKDVQHMMEVGSQYDYAVDRYGHLFVTDQSGKIQTIELSTYHKNRKKYLPLTYNELAEIRAYDDRGLFSSDMLSAIRGSVSIKEIAKKIQTVVKALGSLEVSETEFQTAIEIMGHHLKLPTHKQLQGLQELSQALEEVGPEALFTVLQESKSPNMEAAFSYILNSLGNDEKLALKAKSVIELDGSYSPENMIASALGSFTTTSYKYSEKTSSTTNSKVNAEAFVKAGQSYYLGPVETFLDGNLNKTTVMLTDSTYKNKVALLAQGNVIAAMTDDKGRTYPLGPMAHRLQESGNIKYVDTNSKMYFGLKEISPEELNSIMYDGQKGMRVWLPSDGNGGIDFLATSLFYQTLTQLQQDPEYIAADNVNKALLANKAFKDRQLHITMDANGNFSSTYGMAPYLVYYGYAKDDKFVKGNGMVKTITDKTARKTKIDEMETIYKELGYKDPNGFWNYDDLVKAPVFIKESEFALMDAKSYSGHGPRQTWLTTEELAFKLSVINNPQLAIIASGSLLFNEQ